MKRLASVLSFVARRFTEPEPVLRLEIVRIFAPLFVLGFLSSRLAHVDEWLTAAGFQVPEIPGGDPRQPLHLSPLDEGSAWLVGIVLVLSGLAVSAGLRARAAALVFAIALAYVALADRLAAFTVSKLAPAVMLALAASPVGARLGVGAWLQKRNNPARPLPALAASGGARFFQVLLPVFYCGSGIAKIRGDWLSHGAVLWTHLHDSYQTAFSFALARALPGAAWTVLQAAVLALELLAPLWFAWPRTRPAALALAVVMHAMIGLLFWPVRWFSLLMITLLVAAYLPARRLDRLAARAAHLC